MDTSSLIVAATSTVATVTQSLFQSANSLTDQLNTASQQVTTTAQTVVAKASGILGMIDWSKPNWDLFIILFVVLAVFVYGLSLGRDRVLITTLAIYISLAIVDRTPYLIQLINSNIWPNFALFKALTFGGTFVILFFLLARSALLRSLGARDIYSSWWQVLLFTSLQVGLLVTVVFSFLTPDTLANLSPITLQIFNSDWAKLFWVVAPVLGMLLGRARRRTRKEIDDYL